MKSKQASSILMTGVPLARGTPLHFEHDDDTAYTQHGGPHTVSEVHTPQDSLRRIHELMHARHSDLARQREDYAGIIDPVRQVIEDCRIHLLHWPWSYRNTPAHIAAQARAFVDADVKTCEKRAKKLPPEKTAWPVFATKIRAGAVRRGIDGKCGPLSLSKHQIQLAVKIYDLLSEDRAREAALLAQHAFFDVEPSGDSTSGDHLAPPEKGKDVSGEVTLTMKIIELPHTETIAEATVGTRIASSGPRIWRPALRRPVLPSRMFVRRAAVEPAGTILVDASGSMGSFDCIAEYCKAAPFATVAYYAGDGNNKGWLYVFARGGMRAQKAKEPPCRGNTVDGPALDWLMQQDAPRIIVTDREFCDVPDSEAQIVRLERLEAAGEIEVRDYEKE